MNARSALWMSAALWLTAGCPKRETTGAEVPPNSSGTGDSHVTNTSDAWAQARAIAEKTGAAGLAKWKDDVPYLFQAKGSRGVLVHDGAVVTARGPAAAGAYLRDVGILEGKGPSPGSILTLLYVLQAFPVVPEMPEQSAVDMLGPEDLRPRVERADGSARVILHYRLPSRDQGPSRGTVPVMRETLEIRPTGDAAWRGEQIDHPLP